MVDEPKLAEKSSKYAARIEAIVVNKIREDNEAQNAL